MSNRPQKVLLVGLSAIVVIATGILWAEETPEDSAEGAEVVTIDIVIEEIADADEIEVRSEEDLEAMIVAATAENPVVTRCQLTDKSGDIYRGAKITAANTTDENKTCVFTCDIAREEGTTQRLSCRATIKAKQTAIVCRVSDSRFRLVKIKRVSDSPPC